MVEKDSVKIGENAQAFNSPRLQPDQKVYCQDGYVGKIVALRHISQSEDQSLVMQTGLLFRRRYIVPSRWIDRIDSDRVYLSAKKDDLKSLPEERPDPTLVSEVKHVRGQIKSCMGLTSRISA